MQNVSLRKYLMEKRVELYEKIEELRTCEHCLDVGFSNEVKIELATTESQLNLIKEIITICTERNRY